MTSRGNISIEELAKYINQEHRAVVEHGKTQIRGMYRCGKGLSKVKRTLGHGEFGPWLKQNFDGSQRTAERYMKIYRLLKTTEAIPDTAAFEELVSQFPSADELIEHLDPRKKRVSEKDEASEVSTDDSHHDSPAPSLRLSMRDDPSNRTSDEPVSRASQCDSPDPEMEIPPEELECFYLADCDNYLTAPEVREPLYSFNRIYLDPCCNDHAKPNVDAAVHFTAKDDGLAQRWMGDFVYVNPPYRGIRKWVEKTIEEYQSRNIGSAVMFLPNRSDTEWMGLLDEFPHLVIRRPLTIVNEITGMQVSSSTFPFLLVYLGDEIRRFASTFSTLGVTFRRIDP